MDPQEYEWLFTLSKDPKTWTRPDVDSLCQVFRQQWEDENQTLDSTLTSRLWRYWFFVHGEAPLMEEPGHNLALMAAARAFGEFVPDSASNDYFVQYHKQHEQREAPLAPETLHWGVNAVLSHPNAALEAATSDVCVLRENGQIQEITLIGQNLPEIREELFDAFLNCALRMRADGLDMVNLGGVRLSLPSTKEELLDLPAMAKTRRSIFTDKPNDQTALDLFEELARQLTRIQNHSGFLSVRNGDAQAKAKFDQMVRDHVKACHQSGTARILALDPERHPELQGLITYVPYLQFGNRPRPIQLVLPTRIIDQPSFGDLLEAFKYHTVERILTDAKVRLASYERHASDLQDDKKRWDEASPSLRKQLWGETITLTEKLIVDTGTTVRLDQPIEVPVETYMNEQMPGLISHYQAWARRMRTVIHDLQTATTGADNTLQHLAINLFLDMALREKADVFGDRQIRQCFERWFRQVGPFLRSRWRAALEAKGISPEAIFNRHTIFNTQFLLNEAGVHTGLLVQPFAAVMPATSILLLDPQRRVIQVIDRVDFAERLVETSVPADVLWKSFEEVLTKPDDGKGNPLPEWRDFLGEHALELFPDLLRYMENNWQKPFDTVNWEKIQKSVQEMNEHSKMTSFPSLMSVYLRQGAYHSARELCKTITVPPQWRKHVLLWQALTECLARSLPPQEVIPRLYHSPRSIPEYAEDRALATPLADARKLDPSFTDQWVARLQGTKELRAAIRLLIQDWPKIEERLSSPEQSAYWKASVAVEAFYLSRRLSAAGKGINPDGEGTDTLFAKLGRSLEEILLSSKGVTTSSDIDALLEILLGQERPT